MARWMIQIVYQSGNVRYMRRISRVGPIVKFNDKLTAEVNAEMLAKNTKFAETVSAVPYDKRCE